MQHLRLLVELPSDAVAAIFPHYREIVALGVMLNGRADVAEPHPRPHHPYPHAHALVAHLGEPAGADGGFPDQEHLARVAVVAVLDDGDVDVDDIPVLQRPVVRYPVADDVIDRGADRFREAAVVQRRRDGLLHPDDVFVADPVQLVAGDAGADVGRDHLEHLGGQAAGDAHLLDLLGGLDMDCSGLLQHGSQEPSCLRQPRAAVRPASCHHPGMGQRRGQFVAIRVVWYKAPAFEAN